MATLTPICRGCSRPIILFRNSFRSIKPTYNQTIQLPRWLQPNRAGINRRPYATKAKVVPPGQTTLEKKLGKAPPQPINTASEHANVASHPKNPPVAPPPVKKPESQSTFVEKLMSQSKPVVLYEAAPHKMLLFSSYWAGFSCIIGAGANFMVNVFNAPEGIHYLIPFAMSLVGMAMAVIGTRFALTPSGVVRYIKILPAKSVKSTNPAAPSSPPVRLEIEVRRPIPFMYQRYEVDAKKVVMPAPLYNRKESDDEESILPSGGFLKSCRRGVTGEGFAPIEVDGLKFKLDITDAYVLEEGRALDRLVRIEKRWLEEEFRSMRRR
ncbi:hypothetical protein F5B19DRAFT_146073 [Rostrohypoxylon terebratum]|nr:hypothetical protein F5B19DRAFT_146073 [Rostrohypoxylon terebratum]